MTRFEFDFRLKFDLVTLSIVSLPRNPANITVHAIVRVEYIVHYIRNGII